MTSRVYRCFCQSAVVFHRSWSSCIISSQFVLVYSPLISSIVDFVCSSYQAHYYSSITVRSPLRSELSVKFFLLWGGGRSFARLWCVVSESANWVCLLLSILSIPFILYFLALGSALCVVFHGALRFLEGVFNRPSWLFIVGVVFLGYPCSGFLLGQFLALNHCLFFYAGLQTDHLDLRRARARRLSHTPALYCSSIFFTFFRLGLHCVCLSTVHPAFEQRRFVTVASICNLRRHFFCIFGLGTSVSFLSSLAALAVSSPFGTLALNSCPFAGVQSSHLLEDTSCS